MKKIITLLASAILWVASASAVEVAPVGAERVQPCTLVPQPFMTAQTQQAKMQKAGARATAEDVLGAYTSSCEWLGATGKGERDLEITMVDAATGEVAISGWPLGYVVKAYVDNTGSILTIPNRQFLGVAQEGDSIELYFKRVSMTGEVIDWPMDESKSITGLITPTAIAFDVNIVWAIGNPKNEAAGWFYLAYNMIFEKYIEDWQSIGKATFQDGWILPAFQINQADPEYWYEVEMEQDLNHPTRYRLVNPYKGDSPVALRNTANRTGYIQFDVKDPKHVVFDVVEAGFECGVLGISELYCYNALTGLSLSLGQTPTQIISNMGNNIPYTFYQNGMLMLAPINSSQFGLLQDACLGVQDDIAAAMTWATASGAPANMTTRIWFPGTEPDFPDENIGWTTVGTATFMDGWILPVYGINQTLEENWYDVELQQKDENKNIYRLVDPYHSPNCPVAKYNANTSRKGYIEFDVTDPEHVTCGVVNSGMAIPELQMSKIFCYNTLTYYEQYMGLPGSEIVDIFGESLPYTTFKDGVIDMTHYVTDDPTYGTLYDACVGSQINKGAGQRWASGGKMVDMSTRVTFHIGDHSIEAVGSDNAGRPVEYFNLQGVRIDAPAAGQVVIRRQGSDVSKILVR